MVGQFLFSVKVALLKPTTTLQTSDDFQNIGRERKSLTSFGKFCCEGLNQRSACASLRGQIVQGRAWVWNANCLDDFKEDIHAALIMACELILCCHCTWTCFSVVPLKHCIEPHSRCLSVWREQFLAQRLWEDEVQRAWFKAAVRFGDGLSKCYQNTSQRLTSRRSTECWIIPFAPVTRGSRGTLDKLLVPVLVTSWKC